MPPTFHVGAEQVTPPTVIGSSGDSSLLTLVHPGKSIDEPRRMPRRN
jgi:hypothetical protein